MIDPIAKEYFLPEGSYNSKCTLNSIGSDKEVMVPDLSELSESVLCLMQQNYEKIHCSTGATFKTSLHAKGEVLLVQECYSKEEESYPLDVILPMINYKVEKLPQTKEGYYNGDGDNYPAVKIFADSHGIKMKRVYVYAGK